MNVMRAVPDLPDLVLLDVGCNVGAWLSHCRVRKPAARLAGVELNANALPIARINRPDAVLARAVAERLPFPSDHFDCVTCLEVLEHLPEPNWRQAIREMQRVLKPGGVLIVTVPHAGMFAWMDSNNVRHRLPGLYRRVLRGGLRDANYDALDRHVEWHKHFTKSELETVIGRDGWSNVRFSYGGLFLMPLTDWLSWPFYRAGKSDHPIRELLGRMADMDYRLDFGRLSYGICVACVKA
jgi:ubiquinone/menaquinone biosynthesis C-methylase UbiE